MFKDNDIIQQLEELKNAGQLEAFFSLAMKYIEDHVDMLLDDDGVDIEIKRAQLVNIMGYYADQENYEQCAKIKVWIKMIDDFKNK